MSTPPIVETPSGAIRGVERRVGNDHPSFVTETIHAFWGMPYGQAPVGELRFRPPVPAPRWAEVFDASTPGARAVQPPSMLAPAGEAEGEDCLVCNVWSPDLDGNAPVMVWFHGGSFVTGSSSMSFYDGSRLAARGVVVVSVNYRLGALGFLHLAPFDDRFVGASNLGLADQRLALEWVQTHISSFGGDPERVTIFGESAGAMSVSLHVAAGADSRFHRAIAQSGAAGHVQSDTHAQVVTERVLELVGLSPANAASIVDVPTDALRQATGQVALERSDDIVLPFCPVVDGVTITDSPIELIRRGAASEVAVLSGTNRDEMNLFRLQALLAGVSGDMSESSLLRRTVNMAEFWGRSSPPEQIVADYRVEHPHASNAELWSHISSDTMFRLPMGHMLDAHVDAGGAAWSYLFTHPSHAFDGALGAAHAVEIPFVFDNLDIAGVEFLLGPITDERRAFADSVAQQWVTFASAPDLDAALSVPGSTTTWAPHQRQRRAHAVLDVAPARPFQDIDDRVRAWIDDTDPLTGR